MSSTLIARPGQPGGLKPGEFKGAAPNTVVSWQMKRLAPPSQLYVGVDDVLRVAAASSQANEVVTANYRLLRAQDGQTVVGQFTVSPASDRTVATQDQQLAEGFLLSASCQASAAVTRGQTFARLMLNPKALGSGQPAQMLMADYVTTHMAPAYPNGRVLAPTEGPGWVHFGAIANPAAGSDFIIQVAPNARVRMLGVGAFLSTSATVANRVAQLKIGDGLGKTVFQSPVGIEVAANAVNVFFSASAGFGGSCTLTPPFGINNGLWGFPNDVLLIAPAQVYTLTVNLQAGDQWSSVDFLIEEWLDNV